MCAVDAKMLPFTVMHFMAYKIFLFDCYLRASQRSVQFIRSVMSDTSRPQSQRSTVLIIPFLTD